MTHSSEQFPVALLQIDETDSTNSYLKEYCQLHTVDDLTTVSALFQTSGRGQRGNTWESEKGKNLLFSFVLFPTHLEAKQQFLLSQITSLAIKEILEMYTSHISIKWPNDIYQLNKKMCGMLIENDLTGTRISRSITGIGININQRAFYSEAPNPVSLWQTTGKEEEPQQILQQIMKRVKEYYRLLQEEKSELIGQRYREALFRGVGMHPYKDREGEFRAEMLNVEPNGTLVLKDDTGYERKYTFKEVQYLI